jgi:hypothetical protein
MTAQDPSPLLAWQIRETAVDTSGTWDTVPERQVVLSVEGYLQLLERLGAKVMGLLISLSVLSVLDPQSGERYVEGSQEDLGRLVSGGDGGWTEKPVRDALHVLLAAGLLRKEAGRGLGRNKGSTSPKWYLTAALFDAEATSAKEASKIGSSKSAPSTFTVRKNNGVQNPPNSPRRSPLPLRAPSDTAPYVMDGNESIHPCSDDNDQIVDLLSLAVARELEQRGWRKARNDVQRLGARHLAAWLTVSRERSNPGGFIRHQTQRPEWPFWPPDWDPDQATLFVDEAGWVQSSHSAHPPREAGYLTLKEIMDITDNAGDLGEEIKSAWAARVRAANPQTPDERSLVSRRTGTELISQYGLLPSPAENEV